MIAIIIADKQEVSKWPWKVIKDTKKRGFQIKYFHNNVIEIFSGIGITNAAAATQLAIDLGANKIFNYGAVGGLKPLKIYDVVIPKKIKYHDVITPWYKRGQLPGEKPYFLNNLNCENSYNLASGNSFSFNFFKMKIISKKMNVHIFDMETAAIAQIAQKNNIPLYVIKCVSDIISLKRIKINNINEQIKKAAKIAKKLLIEEIEKYY